MWDEMNFYYFDLIIIKNKRKFEINYSLIYLFILSAYDLSINLAVSVVLLKCLLRIGEFFYADFDMWVQIKKHILLNFYIYTEKVISFGCQSEFLLDQPYFEKKRR